MNGDSAFVYSTKCSCYNIISTELLISCIQATSSKLILYMKKFKDANLITCKHIQFLVICSTTPVAILYDKSAVTLTNVIYVPC